MRGRDPQDAEAGMAACQHPRVHRHAGESSDTITPVVINSARIASWLAVGYRAETPGWVPKMIGASLGEAPSPTGDNYEKMFDWAENLFYDTFGVARRIG